MAGHDPIYHLKDCYFFEVPKSLWRQGWTEMDQVPQWLRDAHPEATLTEFNRAMDGKILIPQPFATLENLFSVKSGFGISKFMILEVALAAILFFLFTRLARKLVSGEPPKGRFANLFETFILFIRDQVARPSIDSHDDHGQGDHDGHGHGSQVHGGPAAALAVAHSRSFRVRTLFQRITATTDALHVEGKVKALIGFVQVIAVIGPVYSITMPNLYRVVLRALEVVYVDIFGNLFIPTECIGGFSWFLII